MSEKPPVDLTVEQLRSLWYDATDSGDQALARLAMIALGEWYVDHEPADGTTEQEDAKEKCFAIYAGRPHPWQASDRDYTPGCAICFGHPDDRLHRGYYSDREVES